MGTEYVVHKDDKLEVSLDEASNRFALCIFGSSVRHYTDADSPLSISHYDILPEQVVHMAVKMLQTASYWMDPDDFRRQLALSMKDHNMLREIKEAVEA